MLPGQTRSHAGQTGLPTPALEEDAFLFGKGPSGPSPVELPPRPVRLPEIYVITGDIKLFGFLDSKLHIFQGMLTPGHPYSEIVELASGEVSLGGLIPSMKDNKFDAIALRNPRFCFSRVSFNVQERAGLFFQTEVIFQHTLQPVSDILHDFFGQQQPSLHVSAYLGAQRNWNHPMPIAELVLRGSLEHVSVNIFDILTFTNIGVELSMFQRPDVKTGKHVWRFGYGFFGDLNVSVPGSVVPLQVDYTLRIIQGQYLLFLVLKDEEWQSVFGVNGLNLKDVQMSAFLSSLSKNEDLMLEVEAALEFKGATFLVKGSYSKTGYCLEAFIGHLSLQDIGDLFNQITGANLDAFDHDVTFDSIQMSISSQGLALSGAITVNGYSTAEGSIAISKDGVFLSGGIGNVDFEDFTVNNAKLDVFIGSTSEHTSTRVTKFSILGDLTFSGINLKIGLFTNKMAGGELKWTIYGQADGDLKTSALSEDIKDSFLDV